MRHVTRWAEVRRTPISKKGKASTSDCSFWPVSDTTPIPPPQIEYLHAVRTSCAWPSRFGLADVFLRGCVLRAWLMTGRLQGGRVQLCGDDIEAEKKRVREWRLSDRQNAELDEYEGFLFEGTEDP